MQISVYVPDPLWSSARAAHPDVSTTALARLAMASLVESTGALGAIRPRPAQLRSVEAVIESKAPEARRWLELGFRAGVRLAETLEWWLLEQLAGLDWKFGEMPNLISWTMIRDDLAGHLRSDSHGDPAFIASLLAELQLPEPNLNRFSLFGDGVRLAMATVTAVADPTEPPG